MFKKFALPGLICLSAYFISCQPPEKPKVVTELEKLPAHTQEGLNTFGCLINGKAFINDPRGQIVDNRYFRLRTWSLLDYQEGIFLTFEMIDSPFREKIFHLTDSSFRTEVNNYISCYGNDDCEASIDDRYNGTGYVHLVDYDTECEGYTDGIHGEGFLEITHFDPGNVVSGTFEFSISIPGCGMYEVTEGRFDLRI